MKSPQAPGRRRASKTTIRAVALALAVLLCALPAAATSPWTVLETLRENLQKAGPQTAAFEQTYIPAGFSTGDVERGRMSIWLPRCLRWSYEDPDEKNFLLCENDVHHWNAEENAGRRYQVDPKSEPGLDLLLVDVNTLRERYVAESTQREDGSFSIHLVQPQSSQQKFEATIEIDGEQAHVLGLEYTDTEGNRTHFSISGYEPLAHTALFQAPTGIEWTEDQ